MNASHDFKKTLHALLQLDEPEMILKGRVDEEMFDYVFESLASLTSKGSPEVKITIDSQGGSTFFGFLIYDALRMYKGNKIGIGVAKTHSTASWILQVCNDRRLTEHAKLLIHNPSRSDVSLDQIRNPKKLAKLLKHLEECEEKIIAVYIKTTGKTSRQIKARMLKNEDFNAQEALEFGLIDEIV